MPVHSVTLNGGLVKQPLNRCEVLSGLRCRLR
eukprot:CAMPEP_0176190562 /NCGR_PEP_ID=MMETSP0121_2-20121125/4001_1 /TAXON_ID=160619 /ORGANISM="Kryptoperidinium foliaceum, Strain CCMP 1326" /LENGTH=31 /DNA_ID= /DNA_START= /DNA_END= /DNA_ORIENTATION=